MYRRRYRRLVTLLTALALLLCFLPAQAKGDCRLTVYFPNWNVYSDSQNQVKNLPWDRLGCVNHAFWKIEPRDGGYPIVSTDPWADTDESNPKAHFPQYAEYAKKLYFHAGNVSLLLRPGHRLGIPRRSPAGRRRRRRKSREGR